MKKVFFIISLFCLAVGANAQETYTNAELLTEDLNGTARYVGMGGAMEALGADISVMGTNPAGIGLFRRSQVSITGSIFSQGDAGNYRYGDGTKTSFDQGGFVWCIPMRKGHFLNIGFNYKKDRNYNNVTTMSGALSGSSQNKNSYMNLMDSYMSNSSGDWSDANTISQLDFVYYQGFNGEQDGYLYYNDATAFVHNFSSEGYTSEYDINISGNVSRRVYLGLTFGFTDLNYSSYSTYSEDVVDANGASAGSITVNDRRRIDGTGFNLKGGIIFFPIENNPLRFGVSIATPTWYDMTSSAVTSLQNNSTAASNVLDANYEGKNVYDYRVYTPWKFGVSAGYTFGSFLALGVSYEFADYSSISSRYIGGYDYYSYYGSSTKDYEMNENTQQMLRGVSTVKLGAEFKPIKELSIRAGYNYVSPMYRDDGYRDPTVNSLGTYYSSRADYTNWGATNRVTVGLGYAIRHFAVDFAYQYSVTNGKYYPFTSSEASYVWSDGTIDNVSNIVGGFDRSDKRSQFVLTLSCKF